MNNPSNSFRRECDILRRCRFWQQVIHDPSIHYSDAALHPYVARVYVRGAKRNLAKLLARYPAIAERLAAESVSR